MNIRIHTNAILDVNNLYIIRCVQLSGAQRVLCCDSNQCQQSMNDLESDTFGNQLAALSHRSKVNVLVASKEKKANDMLVATS